VKKPAPGLRWRKLDLHVHTPASADYTGVSITPQDFVQAALRKGVDAIAVTDHNTAAWIDQVKEAAAETPLAVFPGVEISATGGPAGIHIVALFDRDESSKTVESLLAKLQIEPKQQGKTDALTPFSPIQVIDQIAQMGGLAVLAHADSSKGVLADMKGEARTRVVQSPTLGAAELCNFEKSAGFLDGTDPVYKKELAAYRASDNPNPDGSGGHSAEGIAARYSWFKTDGLTLNALAQCFADPSVRIIPDSVSLQVPSKMYPRMLRISVSQGFLSGTDFSFHEGLNSIIGGKGVGKSLLVEAIRFALDQPSPIEEIEEDMHGKLRDQVGVGGVVRMEVQLEDDRIVVVERTFDDGENPIRLTSAESGEEIDAYVSQLFPILAYSQTEALAIAKDQRAQLFLIDTLLDIGPLLERIADIRERLRTADKEFRVTLQAAELCGEKEKSLNTITEQIARVDRALRSAKHDELNLLQPKTHFLANLVEQVAELTECIDDTLKSLKRIDLPALEDAIKEDADLISLRAAIEGILKTSTKVSGQLSDNLTSFAATLDAASERWAKNVAKKEAEYKKWAEEQGGDRPKLNSQRKRLVADQLAAAKALKATRSKADGYEAVKNGRNKLIAELRELNQELYEGRAARYLEIQEASNGKLELSIARSGDRAAYVDELLSLKKGTNLQEQTIRAIAEKVEPDEFVSYVLTNNASSLAKHADINEKQAEKLLGYLRAMDAFEEVLAIEHAPLCVDSPSIRYRKDDGKYYPLDSISIGQKCTALLIVALADGSRPVIIDQPEDALDTPSVYADVTRQLRRKKEQRQFLVTTHNSTVAVAGDTDRFQVLLATAESVSLAGSGAIDRPLITAHVIQHLEGGEEPFEMKARKYTGQAYRPKSSSN
jgi:ABC-type dipeptide/oligopeptide/nickel transport system ATPase component